MIKTNIQSTRKKETFLMQYSVVVDIQADAETVWNYLTNAAAYPDWNSTVNRIEGKITLGGKIKVFAAISPDRAFPVTVATLEPSKKMVWSGGMPLGLFRAERTFELSNLGTGGTQLKMWEDFSGLLLPLFGGTIPDLRPAFDDFAKDLKAVAEK